MKKYKEDIINLIIFTIILLMIIVSITYINISARESYNMYVKEYDSSEDYIELEIQELRFKNGYIIACSDEETCYYSTSIIIDTSSYMSLTKRELMTFSEWHTYAKDIKITYIYTVEIHLNIDTQVG